MRRIDVTERRARLGVRHRLAVAARADGPVEVARDLVALHSTDPSSVYVAIWARTNGGSVREVERVLYEDRTLIRLLGMRRTVFVTPLDVAPVLQAACSDAVAARERRKLLGFLAASKVADDEAGVRAWLAETEDIAVRALAARGESTAAELAGDDARLRTEVVLSAGKAYEGTQKVASRLLLLLAAEGRVVRGRPRGSWTSHQYRWAPLTDWFPGGLAHGDTHRAEEELARLWLRAFGPATADDLRWWAGWTKTQVKRVLTEVRPVEVDLGGGATGLLLPDDLEETVPPEPWAALLPALDSTPMGWHERGWFLGEHGPRLFDRVGNIGPSLWWDGRVVGGWAQDRSGEIVCRFLEDVGADAEAAVRREAERLAVPLGEVRLSPRTRGRTWLEDELAG
ncbi:winged helix DNA-binding domain-containing protein [Streptomyces sp. NPDC058665]|uniref:winged helix DNA-binding domain-containing protein n=1 Tax=Streptomyces sp. NPDC058665 TaxID=3346586 RepID=UPI0036641B1E